MYTMHACVLEARPAARRYVRKVRLPGGAPASLLAVAPGPALLAAHCGADLGLHVLSCNGRLLVSACAAERLAAIVPSPCGRFLVTGGARGVASLLWLHSLEARMTLPAPDCSWGPFRAPCWCAGPWPLPAQQARRVPSVALLSKQRLCVHCMWHDVKRVMPAAAQQASELQRGYPPRLGISWPLAADCKHWNDCNDMCLADPQCVVRFDGGRGPITALSVSGEECIVAGTHSGALLVFSPDPRRRLTRRAQLAEARPPPGARPAPSPSKTLKFDV